MGGGGNEGGEPKMVATAEEMERNNVPLDWRDYCAHKLIPLNKCRRKNYYLPFRCVDERHDYEKCQYDQYMRRVAEMKAITKAERQAARKSAEEAAAADAAAAEK